MRTNSRTLKDTVATSLDGKEKLLITKKPTGTYGLPTVQMFISNEDMEYDYDNNEMVCSVLSDLDIEYIDDLDNPYENLEFLELRLKLT